MSSEYNGTLHMGNGRSCTFHKAQTAAIESAKNASVEPVNGDIFDGRPTAVDGICKFDIAEAIDESKKLKEIAGAMYVLAGQVSALSAEIKSLRRKLQTKPKRKSPNGKRKRNR